MIGRVGFFHFVQAHEDPLGELTVFLRKHLSGRLDQSLVVLPEGFNLGREYNINPALAEQTRKKKALFDARCILQYLDGIAAARAIVFVVGLIDEGRRNSAYFVDGKSTPRLICHKMNDDGSGEYDCCEECYQGQNPVEGFSVGALLCMDACEEPVKDDRSRHRIEAANKRRERLLAGLESRGGILCVPGAFNAERSSWHATAKPLRGLIIANCLATQDSHIFVNQCNPVIPAVRDANEVRFADI
jgi:hypothetical protein